jgi:hypothetical protein
MPTRGNNEKHSGKDDYAQEKLFAAMLCLISEGALRKRLANAAESLNRLKPVHFSNDEHLKAWRRIMDDLTWAPKDSSDQPEGQAESTVSPAIPQDGATTRCAFIRRHQVALPLGCGLMIGRVMVPLRD